MHKKAGITWGAILVSLGLIFLLNNFIPQSWPLILIGLGVAFLLATIINRLGGLAISGMLFLVLGLILQYQTISGYWASWLFLWPLVTTALGAGLIFGNLFGMGGKKVRLTGWVWFLTGLLFTTLSYAWYSQSPATYSWAWIILGLGLQFVLVSLLSRLPGLAIPGVILAGIGGLLYWQNATGDWASWSYAWPLVTGAVGLSFIVAVLTGLRSRALLWVGLYFVFISAVFFFIFGAFFARDWVLFTYWPLLLILLGVGILYHGYTRRRSAA
jgi:hypothetical protein